MNITIHNQLHELHVRTFVKNMTHFYSTCLMLVFAVHQYMKYVNVSKMHQYNFRMFSTFHLHSCTFPDFLTWYHISSPNRFIDWQEGTNLMQQLWYIIKNYLYMFRASTCPSSGVQVCIRQIQTYTQCTRPRTGSLEPQPQHLVLNTICSSMQPVLLKMGM